MHISHLSYALHLIFILATAITLLISFYYYFKGLIFKITPVIAGKTYLIQHYPYAQVVGVVELFLVAICHVAFCFLLLYLFKVNALPIFFGATISDCVLGGLIGIGSVGVSILFCTIAIKFAEKAMPNKAPKTLSGWLSISNAGWIRHHKHSIKILPFIIALLVITVQVGSEEVIFRSVLFQAFMPFGIKTAFFFATLLFIFMQILHMPSMLSAMFPAIGATVMGIVHGLLYSHYPVVTPLIVSHVTFFIFTVI